MKKQQANKLVSETFETPFEKSRFIPFIKNLLNQIEDAPFTYQGNYIPDSHKDHISKYERIGKYQDSAGNRIDILVVYLKRAASIERARSMQRNFVARYLEGKYGSSADKQAALVAFVSPASEDWRFSLVKMEYVLGATPKGAPKGVAEFTPARRWSFLVGANENSHTAQSRLAPIIADDENNPTLAELEAAFDIEKVSDEFFREYRRLFIWAKQELDEALLADENIKTEFERKGVNTVDLAKKLLGQIIFLYYLQKKGWFGVPKNGQWGDGSKQFLRELFKKKHSDYENFFDDILEPLFYEALRFDRGYHDHYYSRFNCKIPFLNGGLFDPMGNYDWVQTDICLPNALFSNQNKTTAGDTGNGILDVFDRYNFTVREDEPLEKEVAIDPELLGKAYEKFNAIRPDNFDAYLEALKSGKKGDETKFNKKYGVYYTPREIVHYMCQQSLIQYLHTELNSAASYQELGSDQADMFGNTAARGQIAMMSEVRTLPEISKGEIEDLILRGEQIMDHDARVVNAGRETSTYRFKMPEAIRENAARLDEKLVSIKVCDPAVGSGAFPVGMMNEIVKAREVLTTYTRPDRFSKPVRSTYTFKRECIENSLYGVDIDPGAIEIAKLRLWLSLIVDEEDIHNIKPLPNLDYKMVCGNSLVGFPDNWGSPIEKKIEALIHQHFNETNVAKKNELKTNIDEKIESRYRNSLRAFGYQVSFDFRTVFSEVFQQNGGFDVVIANPPYVRQEEIKDQKPTLQKQFACYTGTSDLFVYFFEKGVRLLRENGILTFISSNKYFRSGYGKKLRAYLASKTSICQIINFGDAPIFDAIAYPSILVTQKAAPNENKFNALTWKLNVPLERFHEVLATQTFAMHQSDLTPDGWRLERQAVLNLLEKLQQIGKPLGDYDNGKIFRGIITGLNKAFVVNKETHDRLIAEHPSSADVLKPFLRGRDVKRWRIEFADQYLIKIESSANVKHPWSDKPQKEAEQIFAQTYPAICAHFQPLRAALIKRQDQGKYFWELRSCVYWEEFEKTKIIYPDIYKHQSFTIDNQGYFSGNTSYFIPTEELWLCGLFNSKLIEWFYSRLSSKVQSDYLRAFTDYMKQIPIAANRNPKPIGELVNRILAVKSANPQADTLALEREIDQLVYQLYGLTEEEIAIVEEG